MLRTHQQGLKAVFLLGTDTSSQWCDVGGTVVSTALFQDTTQCFWGNVSKELTCVVRTQSSIFRFRGRRGGGRGAWVKPTSLSLQPFTLLIIRR